MPPDLATFNINPNLPPKRRLTAVVVLAGLLLLLVVIGLVWFAYPRINAVITQEPPPAVTPPKPAPTYVAFNIKTEEELAFILNKVGGPAAATTGEHKLAVSAHLNPLGGLYTDPAYPFAIDRAKVRGKLEALRSYQLPIVLGVFAGKFFESPVTRYLELTTTNLMYDQFNKPILLDRVGGTYFAISPTTSGLPENEFLDIYEANTKAIMAEVADFISDNPDLVLGVSVAGEVKYPPAKVGSGAKTLFRWADYGPLALARYRQFLRDRYQDDLAAFMAVAQLPPATFAGFDEVDPPRGEARGSWDTLDDAANPYFLIWQDFRVAEVKNHIHTAAEWVKEAGFEEDEFTKLYSQQAIWDKDEPKNYYWRGAPIETLGLPGINPVVSMYGDKTADETFIARLGAIAEQYPGRWGSLQYNPDGPCDTAGVCDPDGYPVAEYLRRLNLLDDHGIRIIGVYGDDESEGGGTDDEGRSKHFVRENFYQAVAEFLVQ